MSTTDSRLNRLYPALTAKERALLVLQAWKEDAEEDRLVRSTMPDGQAAEFNRCIALMNGVNKHLGPFVVILNEHVSQLNLKRGWMLTLQLWGMHSSDLGMYIFCHTKEPICESDHAKLLAVARAQMAPVGELAEVLAEREDGSEKLLTAKKAEIARLVEQGAITGQRKGRTLQVNVGSFYDWLGEPTPVYPDWGLEYEVFPDVDSVKVGRLRRELETVRERLSKAPIRPGISIPIEMPEARSLEDEIADGLGTSVKEGIPEYWRQLRASELVIAEVAREFDGEDPALPLLRGTLNWTREQLVDLHSATASDSTLPEPDEETLDRILQLVQRDLPDDTTEMTVTLPAAPSPAPPSAQPR